MKKIYIIISVIFLMGETVFTQPVGKADPSLTPGMFCLGYKMDMVADAGGSKLSLEFAGDGSAKFVNVNDFGNGYKFIACTTAGWTNWFQRWDMIGGSYPLIDYPQFPYMTMRVKTQWDVIKDPSITFNISAQSGNSKSLTIPGDGQWHIIRLDFSNTGFVMRPDDAGGQFVVTFADTCSLVFDYLYCGNVGDPDPARQLSIGAVADITCEKEAGEQTVNLTGISNGVTIDSLSLSQTNSKTTIFEGAPAFTAIQPDGTATMTFTPKAGSIGISSFMVLLTYNRGDTVKKYKTIKFNVNIVSDPKMTVASTVNAQVNQPIANASITNCINSTGGASKLSIAVSCNKTDLITNLVATAVKSDGTSKISFIPGQDLCGTDTITAIITDSTTSRSATYKIIANITSATCIPVDTLAIENSKKAELTVTPNPATTIINVTMPDENGGKLIITDITGITVKEIIVPAGQAVVSNISIDQLAPGIYFVSEATLKTAKKLIVR